MLFLISVLCFLGILCAALALARHIKRQVVSTAPAADRDDFKHHLLSILPIADTHFQPVFPVPAQAVRAQAVRAQAVRAQTVRAQPVVAQPVLAQPVVAQPVVAQPAPEPVSILAEAVPAYVPITPVETVPVMVEAAPQLTARTQIATVEAPTTNLEPIEISPVQFDPAPVQQQPPVDSVAWQPPVPAEPALQPAAAPAIQISKLQPTLFRPRINGLNQSVHDIAANKRWVLPSHPVSVMRLPLHRVGRPRQVMERQAMDRQAMDRQAMDRQATDRTTVLPTTLKADRKPPQPALSSGGIRLLDPAYFNKDMGDLTDPYQPSRLRANDRNR